MWSLYLHRRRLPIQQYFFEWSLVHLDWVDIRKVKSSLKRLEIDSKKWEPMFVEKKYFGHNLPQHQSDNYVEATNYDRYKLCKVQNACLLPNTNQDLLYIAPGTTEMRCMQSSFSLLLSTYTSYSTEESLSLSLSLYIYIYIYIYI